MELRGVARKGMDDYPAQVTRPPSQILEQLTQVTAVQRMLLDSFRAGLADGGIGDDRNLDAKLGRLDADRARLCAELRGGGVAQDAPPAAPPSTKPGRTRGRALREILLDTLDLVGVPAAPTLIAELAHAVAGVDVAPSRFASLRRDDARAAQRDPGARPAWLAPALNATTLTAMPRLLTSSAWPLELRLIAPASLKLVHLRTIQALLDWSARFAAIDPASATQVEAVALRLAGDVPGAADAAQRRRDAVAAELDLLEAADHAARAAAAQRLRDCPVDAQLWGLSRDAVVSDSPM